MSSNKKILKLSEKETRHYTCTRRRNKENKKIWVVLEDGRKFYRIFFVRSQAIKYFETLKTIYAEMLIQDLTDNIYSSITYTKLEKKLRGVISKISAYDGGMAVDSDKFFDEEEYIKSMDDKYDVSKNKSQKTTNNDIHDPLDFAYLETLFPKKAPIFTPVKINPPTPSSYKENKKIVSDNSGITIYQEDIDLSVYVFGDEYTNNVEQIVEIKD